MIISLFALALAPLNSHSGAYLIRDTVWHENAGCTPTDNILRHISLNGVRILTIYWLRT